MKNSKEEGEEEEEEEEKRIKLRKSILPKRNELNLYLLIFHDQLLT